MIMNTPLKPYKIVIHNGYYKHFKGTIYEVIGMCRNSNTLEEYVLYQDTTDKSKIWVRPVDDFIAVLEGGLKRFEEHR